MYSGALCFLDTIEQIFFSIVKICYIFIYLEENNNYVLIFEMIKAGEKIIEDEHREVNLSYDDLFLCMYPALCTFADKFIQNRSASEDVVQDVFMKLWECFDNFNSEIAVKAFLYRSVRHTCINYIKHEKVKKRYVKDPANDLEIDQIFFSKLIENETHRVINEALNELPEKCKKIFILSLNGLKNREIAEDLDLSINTIKTQKLIAQKKLREKLQTLVKVIMFSMWV